MLVDYRLVRYILLTGTLSLLMAGMATMGFAADLRIAKAGGKTASAGTQAPVSRSAIALAVVERLQLSGKCDPNHPLLRIVEKEAKGAFGQQPGWRLPMLVKGLSTKPGVARTTAFSSNCPDGGGPRTRWGTKVRRGICAADPRYWGPGSVIWVDKPVEQILVVEDTGGAIKGKHRFDVCFGEDARAASRYGVRNVVYYPLHVVPPKRSWGTRPHSWQPPNFSLTTMLRDLMPDALSG